MKFVQLGTQIKHNVEKKKIYKNTQKVHYEVHKTIVRCRFIDSKCYGKFTALHSAAGTPYFAEVVDWNW